MKFIASSPFDAAAIQAKFGSGWKVEPHKRKAGVFVATRGKGMRQTIATIRIARPPAKSSIGVMKQSLNIVMVTFVVGGMAAARAIAESQGMGFGILDAALVGALGGGLGGLVILPFLAPTTKRLAALLTAPTTSLPNRAPKGVA